MTFHVRHAPYPDGIYDHILLIFSKNSGYLFLIKAYFEDIRKPMQDFNYFHNESI